MNSLIIINFALSCYLLGLILTMQMVHYPTFIYVDRKLFNKFHLFHVRRISLIVMLPMGAELLASAALLFLYPSAIHATLFSLVVLIWLSTAFLSVPRHNKLSEHKNPKIISELVLTNWPRTILWFSRVVILIFVLRGSLS